MSSSKLWEWAVSSYHTKVSLNQLFKPREGRKQWVELEARRWVEGDKRKVTFQSRLLFYYLTANAEFFTSWPWRASGATSSPYLSSLKMHIFKGTKRSKLVHPVPSCFGHVAPIKHTTAHGGCFQSGHRCSRSSQESWSMPGRWGKQRSQNHQQLLKAQIASRGHLGIPLPLVVFSAKEHWSRLGCI